VPSVNCYFEQRNASVADAIGLVAVPSWRDASLGDALSRIPVTPEVSCEADAENVTGYCP
jgi:hypothetical protein